MMDDMYARLFANFELVGERKNIKNVNLMKPRKRLGDEKMKQTHGYEVRGDEILRGKTFKKYAKNRMSAVRFLKPGVPYLRFKHANLESKQKMCFRRFELADASSYFFQ